MSDQEDRTPLERFVLGRIRGATDEWPEPAEDPGAEPMHPFTIPDGMPGPFGDRHA
jgi:hypothetical protein